MTDRCPPAAARPPKVVLGLDQADAAAAIGISLSKFKELVADKELPKPRRIGRRKVWDLEELTDRKSTRQNSSH